MQKRSPKSRSQDTATPEGFGEAPQKPLSGAPLSGSISDWAAEIAEEADKPAPKAKSKIKDPAAPQDLAPGAPGTISRTARTSSRERERAGGDGAVAKDVQEGRKAKLSPKGAKARGKIEKPTKSARGTSIGKADSARERAAGEASVVEGVGEHFQVSIAHDRITWHLVALRDVDHGHTGTQFHRRMLPLVGAIHVA